MKNLNVVIAIATVLLLSGCVKTDGFNETEQIGMEEIQGKYSVVSSTCPFASTETSFEVSENGAIVASESISDSNITGMEDPSVVNSYPLYISSTGGGEISEPDSSSGPDSGNDTVKDPEISGSISISGSEINATISHAGITHSCRVSKTESGATIRCDDVDCTIEAQRKVDDTPSVTVGTGNREETEAERAEFEEPIVDIYEE